jgi:uncharacterized protein
MTPTDPAEHDRPRDGTGRPRNDRPRDPLGRPLPRGSADGVPAVPEDLDLDTQETVALARQLWAQGRPFAAHEVFEAAWKSADDPDDERLWRGLAQLMVAATHAMRGNVAGAAALFARSDETLAPVDSGRGAAASVDVAAWHRLVEPLRPPSAG